MHIPGQVGGPVSLPRRAEEPPEEPAEDLRSRTDARRERKQAEDLLIELARALTELADRVLAKLDLPEAVRDAVVEARRVRSPSARKRALRLVRTALRYQDVTEIGKRLEKLR